MGAGWEPRASSQCPLSHSPKGAIPTGQQVVEDIERGLTGWTSGHTQLFQKHGLQHSTESVWAGGQA